MIQKNTIKMSGCWQKNYTQENPFIINKEAYFQDIVKGIVPKKSIYEMANITEISAIYGSLEEVKQNHGHYSLELFVKTKDSKVNDQRVFIDGRCNTDLMDLAVAFNHLDIVKWLNINCKQGYSSKAKYFAIKNGHFTMLQWLCANKSDTSTNLLEIAAMYNRLAMFKWLYDNNVERRIAKSMFLACKHGSIEVFNWLYTNKRAKYGYKELLIAIEHNNIEIVKSIIKNSKVCIKRTIDTAAKHSNLDMIKFLHEFGDELATKRALTNAINNDHYETALWLYNNRSDGYLHGNLFKAAYNNNIELIAWVHTNLNMPTSTYEITAAAAQGHFELVKWLLANRTRHTISTLDAALENGHFHIYKYLRSINPVIRHSTTVIKRIPSRFTEIIQYVFNRIRCDERQSALTTIVNNATEQNCVHILELYKIPPSDSSLKIAAKLGHTEVLTYLYENNRLNYFPVEECLNGHQKLAAYLLLRKTLDPINELFKVTIKKKLPFPKIILNDTDLMKYLGIYNKVLAALDKLNTTLEISKKRCLPEDIFPKKKFK